MIEWILLGGVAILAIWIGRHAATIWKLLQARSSTVVADEGLGPESPEIRAAVAKARSELPAFLSRMAKDGVDGGYVALRDPRGSGAALEWAEVLEVDAEKLRLRPVDGGAELEVSEAVIQDWQVDEGEAGIRGGYTVRAVLDHMGATGKESAVEVAELKSRYL